MTGASRWRLVFGGIVLVLLPFVLEALLGNGWVRIVDFSLLYVLLALGLNIVVGYAGLLDLGYVAFFAVGAYVYALLDSPQFGLHWPIWAVLPTGALLAACFGVLLGAPTLKLRGDYLAIVTLGFGEIIRVFLNNLDSPINITNGPQGIELIDSLHFGGVSLGRAHHVFGLHIPAVVNVYYLFLAAVVLGMVFSHRFDNAFVCYGHYHGVQCDSCRNFRSIF